MFVTAHAYNRVVTRSDPWMGMRYVDLLERLAGEPGTIAYILGRIKGKVHTPDGSNGDVVVAVAIDGSVETVYFRRATQDMSAEFFGARRVVDLTGGAA